MCTKLIHALSYSTLQKEAAQKLGISVTALKKVPHCNTPQHTATHCNTLHHTATPATPATRCNTLQHAATCCNTLQHAATRGNTLQHAAPRCNTLQHTPQVWVFLSMLPRGSIKKSLSTRPMYTQKSLIYSTEPYIHYREAPYTLERVFRTLKDALRTPNHILRTLQHILTPQLGGWGFLSVKLHPQSRETPPTPFSNTHTHRCAENCRFDAGNEWCV